MYTSASRIIRSFSSLFLFCTSGNITVKLALLTQLSKCFFGLCSWSTLLKKKYFSKKILQKNWPSLSLEIYLRSTRYEAVLKCFWWTIEVNYTNNENLPLNITLVCFFLVFERSLSLWWMTVCNQEPDLSEKSSVSLFWGWHWVIDPFIKRTKCPQLNNILAFLSTRYTTAIYALMEKQKPYC